jgi:hypothetical protein
MALINKQIGTGILALIGTAILLWFLKPSFMFKKNGQFKNFGVGSNKTILPFWLAVLIVGIVAYGIS